MALVFILCAAVGTTFLLLQFLMSLIGWGSDSLAGDVPHDLGHDLGGGDHDLSGDSHGELSHDDAAGEHDVHASSRGAAESHRASTLFRMLSLRTMVAAMAFFGLSGLAAQAADFNDFSALLIAAGAGLAAMYAVYASLRAMRRLQAEGTARIQQAVGEMASVYLRIPAHQQGAGKIQINIQNRTMEYRATTTGEGIPTGAAVVVVQVLGADIVQVQRVDVPQPLMHP